MRPGAQLHGRDAIVASAVRLLAPARGGQGQLLVIEGPAGIGKTELLRAVAARATEDGMSVLTARCDELERDYPYSVARQIFEPRLAAAGDDERAALLAGAAGVTAPVLLGGAGLDGAAVEDDPSFPMLHGLFWLVSNLAARQPLVLAVDDADFADPASLRWLAHLARRVGDTPLLLAVTVRPVALTGADGATHILGLIAEEGATVVRPPPLDESGAARMLAEALAEEPDAEFVRACHVATGGNPLLLRHLGRSLRLDGIAPTAGNARGVEHVTPEQVLRATRLRMARLDDDDARALARAVAVLGTGTDWHVAAALAELDAEAAARAADALAAAEILDPGRTLEFVHPIVRLAVYRSLPEGERTRAHRRAAELLADHAAAPDRAASHLLRTHPSGTPWVVDVLRDAARRASAEGAPDSAAAYLRRALAEPPGERQVRAAIELELGAAEARAGRPSAVGHLTRALAEIEDPRAGAKAALELGLALVARGRVSDAVPTLQHAIDLLQTVDPGLAARVEADMIAAARLDVSTLGVARERLAALATEPPTGRGPELLLLGVLALDEALLGRSAERVGELAALALSGELPPAAHSPPLNEAAYALAIADRLDDAERFHDQALRRAQQRGSAVGFAITSCWRSHCAFRRGDVDAAEAEARNAIDTAGGSGWQLGIPASLASLLDALVEQGRLDDAERALAEYELPAGAEGSALYGLLLFSRGRLRLAQRRPREALDDLLACGRHQARSCIANPAVAPWRSTAALAHAALGDESAARELVYEELSLARAFGAPRAIGIALATAGVLDRSEAGDARLAEAIDVLEGSVARLEHARALTDLGAALRRRGRRAAARELLRVALDQAHRCGASALADRARVELKATGARPRRPLLSGLDALTPSELRVAEMAAEGMTNRDIAQALFVTLKTVEIHLHNAYRKLEIGSRSELPAALAAGSRP